jgi:hypothetical protein
MDYNIDEKWSAQFENFKNLEFLENWKPTDKLKKLSEISIGLSFFIQNFEWKTGQKPMDKP